MKHLFGPVLSHRLGRSLGLDLLGGRICSLDCVYCECGATDVLTRERAPYVPAGELMAELDAWLAEGHAVPDYVTLGGRGEPCLNTDLAAVIEGVRQRLPGVPVAVLTNATCLDDPEVVRDLCLADAVLPSLDALDPHAFRKVNRPHRDVDPERVAASILEFRKRFPGKLWLEVLLVKGMNHGPEHLQAMRAYCRELKPDRVDVVTLTRPGTVDRAKGVDQATLDAWREALGQQAGPDARDKALARDAERAKNGFAPGRELEEAALASLARRPQTIVDLAAALETRPEDLAGLISTLEAKGRLKRIEDSGGETFWFAPPDHD